MVLHHITKGSTMEARYGLIGTLFAWLFNVVVLVIADVAKMFNMFAFSQFVEILQIISLLLAVVASVLTIFWYIGNMIIKQEELETKLKKMLTRIRRALRRK